MSLRIITTALAFSAISVGANANDCEISIDANDAMQFSSKTLSVPATCEEVTLTLNHTGSYLLNPWAITLLSLIQPTFKQWVRKACPQDWIISM